MRSDRLRLFFAPSPAVALEDDDDGSVTLAGTLVHLGKILPNGDRLLEGCLDEWLQQNAGNPLLMLWAHMTADVIGRWDDVRLTGKRLLADGAPYSYIRRAAEAVEGLRRGDPGFGGVSIAFGVQSWDDIESVKRGKNKYGWDFKRIQLQEASLVPWPMDRQARARARVKGLQNSSQDAYHRAMEREMTRSVNILRSMSTWR